MNFKKIALFTLLGFVSTQAAILPGMAFSATQNGINTVNDIIVPYVFDYLSKVHIPDQAISGGQITNIKFNATAPAAQDISLTLDSSTNGISFSAQDITAYI